MVNGKRPRPSAPADGDPSSRPRIRAKHGLTQGHGLGERRIKLEAKTDLAWETTGRQSQKQAVQGKRTRPTAFSGWRHVPSGCALCERSEHN